MKIFNFIVILVLSISFSKLSAQPAAPENLNTSTVTFQYEGISKTAVKLIWDKVKDEEGNNIPIYEIFRKDGDLSSPNEFTSLGQVLWANHKFDNEVIIGNTYTYYVVAKDFSSKVSDRSNYSEITVGDDSTGSETSSISGTVIDAETKQPIENVNVVMVSTSSMTVNIVKTDAFGKYIGQVLPGEYIIYFRADQDYFHQYFNNVKHVWEATRISLNDGEELSNIDVELEPINYGQLFEVSGKVTDNDGNPLIARINVFIDNSEKSTKRHYHARTDNNGNYSVMVPENVTIIVFAMPIESGFYGEFYDNTNFLSEADRIFVDRNISNIDFKLDEVFEGNASLKGIVQNSDEEPVEAMIIAIKLGVERNNRHSSLRTFTDQGSFSYSNLLPGDYILYAIPEEGYLPTFYKENGEITNSWKEADVISLDNNSSKNIVLNLTEIPNYPEAGIGELSGSVTDDQGQPVSEAILLIYDNQNQIVNYSLTDLDGKYSVSNLETGFYTISCSNYGLSYEENNNVFVGIDNQSNSNFILSQDIPVNVNKIDIINQYILIQNYPNPFNPSTIIEFSILEQSEVELKVFDILGAEIKTLMNNQLPTGNYKVEFSANDLPSGLYIYQLKTKDFIQSRKMLLLK